ncbi:unnamed protein product [Amaranthus hypochondriacus]
MDMIDLLWKSRGKSCVESFVTLGWQLWKARNEAIFEDSQAPSRLCVRKASDWLQEYQKAVELGWSSTSSTHRVDHWHRPPVDFIKVNVDGAFTIAEDKQGIGVVARDSTGSVVLAGSKTLWHEGSVEMVEARAVLWALDLAKAHGWRHVIIEGDCKLVIEALQGIRNRSVHIQTIIDNCLAYRHDFASLSFVFCYRTCNGVAHQLAKWAACGLSDEIWELVIPV